MWVSHVINEYNLFQTRRTLNMDKVESFELQKRWVHVGTGRNNKRGRETKETVTFWGLVFTYPNPISDIDNDVDDVSGRSEVNQTILAFTSEKIARYAEQELIAGIVDNSHYQYLILPSTNIVESQEERNPYADNKRQDDSNG